MHLRLNGHDVPVASSRTPAWAATSATRRGSISASSRVAATYGYEYFFDNVDASSTRSPPSGGGSNASGESQIGGAFSQTQFTYGIFDLITGLRYDTYAIDGTFTGTGRQPAGPHSRAVRPRQSGRSPQPESDAGRTGSAVAAALCAPTPRHSGRRPSTRPCSAAAIREAAWLAFGPNPFLEPEIQKGWEFGFNIRKDRLFTRNDSFRLKAALLRHGCRELHHGLLNRRLPPSILQHAGRQGAGRRGGGHVRRRIFLRGPELYLLEKRPACAARRSRCSQLSAGAYGDRYRWVRGSSTRS